MLRTRTAELPVVSTEIPAGAILAADFGSVTTRVVLLDKVADSYRLVGRAQVLNTADSVLNSAIPALDRALIEISALLGQSIKPDRETGYAGEGAFFTTTSGGRQVRAVLIGLTDTVSEAAGLRALAGTYLQIVESITFEGNANRESALNILLHAEPDLIVVVGGTDGGASAPMLSLLRVVRSAILLDRDSVRPQVLFAGNQRLREAATAIFSRPIEERTPTDPRETITDLYFAENIRPELRTERRNAADFELALIYGTLSARALPGYAKIAESAKTGVLPTSRAISPMIAYLGSAGGTARNVIYADVGAASTTLISSSEGRVSSASRSNAGLGSGLSAAVRELTIDRILPWLRAETTQDAIYTYALNKMHAPASVPVRPADTDLELGVARELIRAACRDLMADERLPRHRRTFESIIGGGGLLANTENPALSALLLIDSLEPVGVSRLRADPYGILPALGAIAHANPLPAIQALETNAFLELGTAICLEGRIGKRAVPTHATLRLPSGRETSYEIPVGGIAVLPLGTGQRAELSLKTSGDLKLEGRSTVKLNVIGGAAGVVIDTRGRPWKWPTSDTGRIAMLDQWYSALLGE